MHGLATGSESRQQLYTMMTRGAQRQPRLPRGRRRRRPALGDPPDPGPAAHPHRHPRVDAGPRRRPAVRDQPHARAGRPRHPARRGRPALPRQPLRRRRGPPAPRHRHRRRRHPGQRGRRPGQRGRPAASPASPTRLPGPRCAPICCCSAQRARTPSTRSGRPPATGSWTRAHDRAAVLDWRLDASGLRNAGAGPLPWMPGGPGPPGRRPALGCLPRPARAPGRASSPSEVRDAGHRPGRRCRPGRRTGSAPEAATVADVEVWRAAMQVPVDDRRPTGAPQLQKASATWQRRLNRRVTGDHTPALKEWRQLLYSLAPQVRDDEFTPLLAERLAAMSRAGVTAHQLLRTAAAPDHPAGPLPDEHAAAALWWRMARHLTPAVAAQIGDGSHGEGVTTEWTHAARDLLGPERAARIQASTWWPALVTNIDHGLQRGWQLEALLGAGPGDAERRLGRASTSARPWCGEPRSRSRPHPRRARARLPLRRAARGPVGRRRARPGHARRPRHRPRLDRLAARRGPRPDDDHLVDAARGGPGRRRRRRPGRRRRGPVRRGRPRRWPPTSATSAAPDWSPPTPTSGSCTSAPRSGTACPVTRERMLEINEMTQAFFEARFTDSWGRDYLTDRFGDRPRRPRALPARAGAGRLDQPGRPPAPPRRQRRRDAGHRGRHQRQHRPTDRPVPRPRDVPGDPPRRGARVRRPTPPRPHRRRQGRPEVPQHRRHPAVPQGRPAVRRRRRAPRPRAPSRSSSRARWTRSRSRWPAPAATSAWPRSARH